MDFFEKQAQAQLKTKWLIGYFILAVVGIIAVLQVVFSLLLGRHLLDPEVLTYVSGGVIVVVMLGSLIKTAELSQGGRVVATMLGGQLVDQNTSDLAERKLLNVVEEMALASGLPVPEIYVLPEETINAFAAGHGPGDTAIGVTRGCITQLTRDELQGVIGHEFSHILHGDMKLNIRLMGLLAGIVGLAMLGRVLLDVGRFMPSDGGRDRRDNNNNLGMVILLGGLALVIVGWIGVFFGSLIKAAVSRQREFLADASAVQYTRNPDGIANALWKIGKFHSKLSSPRASEASHLYFGNGIGDPWSTLFATHPPLDERIKAIEPNFEPEKLKDVVSDEDTSSSIPAESPAMGFASGGGGGSVPPPIPPPVPPSLPAATIMASLPAFAVQSVRNAHDACAFVYALLLDEDETIRAAQLAGLKADDSLRGEALALFGRRSEIALSQRLPLVDLVIPTLRQLSPEQYASFRADVRHLVESDAQMSLFEYALQKTLLRHLDLFFTKSTGAKVKFKSLPPLVTDVAMLLSALAYVGHDSASDRDAAFASGVKELLINTSTYLLVREDTLDFNHVDAALDRIAQAAPNVKRTILTACRSTVSHDGVVEPEEFELIRAIADALDCPLPPLPAVTA